MDIRGEYWSTEKEYEEGLAICKKEKGIHTDEEVCS